MRRALPLLTSLALLTATGIVHGVWAGRWTPSHAVEDATARLGRVPLTIGDWQGRPLVLDAEQREAAGIDGYLMRRYEDRRTGRSATVLLLCGRAGPMSIHAPDVCYPASGYEASASPVACRVATTPPAEFAVMSLIKPDAAVPARLRVFWGWHDAKGWRTPDNPRLAFAAAPVLYKLYVTRELARKDEPVEGDPCTALIRQLLPELDKALFAAR